MKNVICAFAIVLLVSVSLKAQISATADAQVRVNVVSAMLLENIEPLNFGAVVVGNSASISSDPNDIDNVNSPALFHIQATSGITVQVTLNPPAVLSNGGGSDIVFSAFDPLRSDDSGGNDNLQALDGWSWGGGDGTGTLETVNGSAYLWLGGEISTDANQDEGEYTGLYDVYVEYIVL